MDKSKSNLVMIVSSVQHNADYMMELVESNGWDAASIQNARLALEYLDREQPDLILLEAVLPDEDGFELCHIIKQRPETIDTPIIMLLSETDPGQIAQAMANGAVDYISKPYNGSLVHSRLLTQLELKKNRVQLKEYAKILKYTNVELHAANQLVMNANEKLQDAIERAEILSRRDYLTGLYNRLYMMERIQDEIARFNRSNKHFGIVIGDVDNLRSINETYGQECGDLVLKGIAQVMQKEIRAQDSLGRWGGEEFILILPETGVCGAAVAAEKIRDAVAASPVQCDKRELNVTMTFGVFFYDGYLSIDQAINKADNALLEGKEKGKNAVVMAD